ncbi:hypothetical protein [Endobacterium cereale]|uniref:hypothetical protein n=1 Tax=Endobacterium cereale TaxID=2663029 RepID=UPI002B48967A|nr:hypothetical protein [Endobacterium cereale]
MNFMNSINRQLFFIPALTVCAVTLLLYCKSPSMFWSPRFFGEEGTILFPKFLQQPALVSVFNVYLGSLYLLTNLAVLLSTTVSLEYAPVPTTCIAFAVQAIVAYQLGAFIREYDIGRMPAILLVVAYCLQWGSYEVSMSATNLQWVLGVSALLILVMPVQWIKKYRLCCYSWLFFSGLSGVPVAILAPAFFFRFLMTMERPLFVICVILGTCALLQLTLIISSGSHGRSYSVDYAQLFFPILMQTLIEPIVGPETISLIGTYISGALPGIGMLGISMIVLSLGFASAVVFVSWDKKNKILVATILFAGIYITLIQTVAALQKPTLMTGAGSRYFFTGVTSVLLLCAVGSLNSDKTKRTMAKGVLLLITCGGVTQFFAGTWNQYFTTGPSFYAQSIECQRQPSCIIQLWPNDGITYLRIDDDRIVSSLYPLQLPPIPVKAP